MIAQFEHAYISMIKNILDTGEYKHTRNAETIATFGQVLKVTNLEDEFPLLRGRKMFYNGVFGELGAMLQGATHIDEFKERGCNYWDQWADENGNLNIDYGSSWLDFNGVNQVEELINGLKTDPNDRRHIITGWRPDRLKELSLPCCHLLYQWYVRDEKYLDMIWYQRSVDVMVGLPSDIIFAAAWNILIAQETDYIPGDITFMLGDTHIYTSHIPNTHKYLRQAKEAAADTICLQAKYNSQFLMEARDIEITKYDPMDAIKFEVHA